MICSSDIIAYNLQTSPPQNIIVLLMLWHWNKSICGDNSLCVTQISPLVPHLICFELC